MSLFPGIYSKPRLVCIVKAAENGWSAKCATGGTPSTGWTDCANGPAVGTVPLCPGHGSSPNNNSLYGGRSSGLINPADVSRGL